MSDIPKAAGPGGVPGLTTRAPEPLSSPGTQPPSSPQQRPAAVVPAFPEPRHRALGPLRSLRAPGAAGVDELPGLVALGPVPTERKARDWALVLQSMSVWHLIRRSFAGWVLLVRDEDYHVASRSIDRYEAENRDWPPRPVRERAGHARSFAIPIIFLALMAFFLVTGPSAANSMWFVRGVSISGRVLHDEPWRAVTALTLHADAVHVLGNAISGTVFVSALQRRLGAGGASLAVLASGVAGNLANAVYYQVKGVGHASLGASTAVFGTIGLLAATQVILDRAGLLRRRSWIEIAAPIVGGFALLGALGSGGERTDLGAHLFGLLAGVVIGLVVALPLRRTTPTFDLATGHHGHQVGLGAAKAPRRWSQALLGAVALSIVLIAWQRAMRG